MAHVVLSDYILPFYTQKIFSQVSLFFLFFARSPLWKSIFATDAVHLLHSVHLKNPARNNTQTGFMFFTFYTLIRSKVFFH